MKLAIIGDIHWSTYSSILRGRGNYFSHRLENLIQSLSWVEQISKEYGCEEEIFLGDTFDRPDLNAEEISALSEVEWNKSTRLKHFIVGNHESGVSSLIYNSTQILHRLGVIEDKPYIYPLDEKTEILFLPYITEDNRKPLIDYLENRHLDKKLIVCSHNDIKDFQMGAFLSKTGFSIDEIESNCDLYLNGHLHNCGWVSSKLCNVGNLTGQNFSEDAFRYEHHILILDTDTLECKFIENPYALNFYKVDIEKQEDINKLNNLKSNAVLSIRCEESLENITRNALEDKANILEYKLNLFRDIEKMKSQIDSIKSLSTKDHLEAFKLFILSKDDIGNSEVVLNELSEVCK